LPRQEHFFQFYRGFDPLRDQIQKVSGHKHHGFHVSRFSFGGYETAIN
jgi:hypothetical protein